MHTAKWASTLLAWSLVACHGHRAEPETPAQSQGAEQPKAQGPACGKITCAAGEVCCNPSCSICTPPDGLCTQQFCMEDAASAVPPAEDETPSAEQAPVPGEQAPTAGAEPGPELTCDNVRCAAGTHCEMVQVQCVRAPCPPVPQCRPDKR